MPSAKILSEKQAVVAQLTERLQKAESGVFVDYRGVTVAQDMEIRRELKAAGVEYSVNKNTLTRFAVKNIGLDELESVLTGTTSMATAAGDPIAPFRIISDYSKKLNGLFTIKAAFMDGKVLSADEIEGLSSLPSKDALYAKVLGTMLAPITSLAVVLGQIAEKGGAAAAAPAEPAAVEAAEAPAAE